MSSRSHHRDPSPHHRHKHHKKHKKKRSSSPSRHSRSRSGSPDESHERDRHRPRKHKMRHHDEEKHTRHREHSTSPRRRERKDHDNRNRRTENGDRNRRAYRYSDNTQPPVRIKQERDENDERRRRDHKNKPTNPFQTSENNEFGEPGTSNDGNSEQTTQPKQGPDFGLSGKLAEETNTYRGVVIKYNEPPEARKPKKKWRLYVFKGQEQLPVLQVHRQSAYLLGRDRIVADIPIDHPSCSKQHAALQFRLVNYQRVDGTMGRRVKPFVIDLNSSNGTVVNNNKIDPQRYVELFEKDVVKFGYSSREYVLLHEKTSVDVTDEEDNAQT